MGTTLESQNFSSTMSTLHLTQNRSLLWQTQCPKTVSITMIVLHLTPISCVTSIMGYYSCVLAKLVYEVTSSSIKVPPLSRKAMISYCYQCTGARQQNHSQITQFCPRLVPD